MMKKLLVLLSVLVLVSMANAAVTEYSLTTDGDVLFVTGTAGASIDGDYIISVGSAIDITVPQSTGMPILHTTIDNGGNNDYTAGDLAAVSIAAVGGSFGDIAQIFALTSPATGDSVDDGLWFTIDIDDLAGSYTYGQVIGVVAILDKGAASRGSVDLTYIPEPMTVALLGLGGLFLRRRK